jgi:hypothetical protein
MCSRWNKHSKWVVGKVTKCFVFPVNWKGGEEFVVDHIHEWDVHWKAVNASFEETFNADENLKRFSGKMFFVWDDNH